MKKSICFGLIFSLCFSVPAHAEDTGSNWLILLDRKDKNAEIILHSLIYAFDVVNSELEYDKKTALYCQPRNMILQDDQAADIFKGFLKENPEMGKFPFGMVLLDSLEKTFPCDRY